jgi:hypothetical protein
MLRIVLDTETTGLPDRVGLQWGQTHPYTAIERYNSCRLVQLCIVVTDEAFVTKEKFNWIIDAGVHVPNPEFHGVTDAIVAERGISVAEMADRLDAILRQGVGSICAHNAAFDMNVIRSELFRANKIESIRQLDAVPIFCSMQKTTDIVCIPLKGRRHGFKPPTLAELYVKTTGKRLENAHNCVYDTDNLVECLQSLFITHSHEFL